ncbi:MAG: extracellular solute-binding protein [Candidatus Krumholzibacteriota bacterium]|nr:extracellular solute-binding protein [Candidatus Krumholzibacteriota bacterium]
MRQRRRILAALPLAASLLAAGCGGGGGDGRRAVTVWAHAGQEAERAVLEDQAARFNAAQDSLRVALTLLPEGGYNAQVQAAALAGDLPDLLEFDGPFLAAYVWRGQLQPLDSLLPAARRAALLPTLVAQGRMRGRLWAAGVFDSGLGLYARRSRLAAAGARLPAGPADAWTAAELDTILRELAARDEDGAVLDLKLDYAGEWYTYAISPLIQSGGGDLVDRESGRAAGTLDGPASVAVMTALQRWIAGGLVDPNLDGAAFVAGRAALALGGHWNWPAYSARLGEDLALLPLPDFGEGSRTGMGSWCWGITRRAARPADAAAFLDFLLSPDEVLAACAANGAVPGTRTALARSPLYGEDGPLRLFAAQLLGGRAVPRPVTPAYPVITTAFQEAVDRIRDGADVAEVLAAAAAAIDREIADNDGYPWPADVD